MAYKPSYRSYYMARFFKWHVKRQNMHQCYSSLKSGWVKSCIFPLKLSTPFDNKMSYFSTRKGKDTAKMCFLWYKKLFWVSPRVFSFSMASYFKSHGCPLCINHGEMPSTSQQAATDMRGSRVCSYSCIVHTPCLNSTLSKEFESH